MGNRILTTAVLLIIVAGTFSCKDWFADLFEDEAYTLTREDYTGNQIRTDGYYYSYYKSGSDLVGVTIFYRNGVVIDGTGGRSLSEFDEVFSNGTFYNNNKNNKDIWGIFKVVNNEVMIERAIADGLMHRLAFIDYGKILNDTTIHIYKNKESYGNDVTTVKDDTLHFKQFSPKPDSTNVFIK